MGAASKVGRGKEVDFRLEPPKKNVARQHLDFSPVRPRSDF